MRAMCDFLVLDQDVPGTFLLKKKCNALQFNSVQISFLRRINRSVFPVHPISLSYLAFAEILVGIAVQQLTDVKYVVNPLPRALVHF